MDSQRTPDAQNRETAPEKKSAPKKKRPLTPREKLESLWHDKRSWKARLFNALPVSFAVAYTFCLFQPLEVFIKNNSFMPFGIKTLTPSLVFLSLGVFLGLGAILTLVRGKVHNTLVSLSVGFLICGYLQCNLFNVDHGTLDGAVVSWHDYKTQAVLNLLLWVFLISLPFILHFLLPKIWKISVRALSGLLVVMQTVALIVMLLTSDSLYDNSENGYLKREGIYDVSSNNNVIVFLLDRFDNKYADAILESDPALENEFGGFTFYENFVGSYSRTYPSVAYLLTGVKTDYSVKPREYLENAFTTSPFLAALRESDVEARLYTDVPYTIGNAEWLIGTVENAAPAMELPQKGRIVSAMMILSSYRWTPEALNPYFHYYTNDYYNYIYDDPNADYDVYSSDDVRFRADLVQQGLTVRDNAATYLFYHLQGSHEPYYMDANGNRATFPSDQEGKRDGMLQQTKGDIGTLLIYIQKLKDAGLYDNTTIIVTADHGRTGTITDLEHSYEIENLLTGEPDTGERVPTLMVKPAGADTSIPLQRSQKQLSHENLGPTILEALGIEHSSVGRSINDIGETEEVVRYFYMSGAKANRATASRDCNFITYRIVGDANDFANWEKIDVKRIEYPYYDSSR